MIRAIIIDDEQHCIDRLMRLLDEHCKKDVLLMDSFASYEDGIKGIARLQPELVFLDVQIKDKTGFELLKQIGEINFEVIFTTAYEKFAVQAFKFSATDFLLKPIVAEDLVTSIQKLNNKLSINKKEKKNKKLILNVKEEGLEQRVLSLLDHYSIEKFFFLDMSFPFMICRGRECFIKMAIRFSEHESLET